MKKPLVVLSGATASGKSETAVLLAKRISGEIVSADSMQVYIGMDIGSAKITENEMDGIKHHLLDVLEPSQAFSAAVFKEMALKAMGEIFDRGNIPIITGGTGFYIHALLYDSEFGEISSEINDSDGYESVSRDKLWETLKAVDPISADAIHPNNVKRVKRAIDYYNLTGRPFSEHNKKEREKASPYDFKYFVLYDDRKAMYARIDERVDKMIDAGLVGEVRALYAKGCTPEMVSMQGIGYKELIPYIDGDWTLEQSVDLIKKNTRHYAKRQLTWFRREKDAIWINIKEFEYNKEKIVDHLVEVINNTEATEKA
ncbi:MAG: tRNA (adenosine(37)-N6)-dimethylallyltransferase MiaA [Lachnospiraceae bacterium]|jgi:tRNA dimethylallyltransferase|nr:tRNA (adenosine(37)-N6)-dimethylallyltransferase MiaA [Lachnospiraceae bacterium]